MPKAKKERQDDDMLPEYDFTNAVRGRYAERYNEKTNIVVLEPDVAEAFPNATAVNRALRSLLKKAQAK